MSSNRQSFNSVLSEALLKARSVASAEKDNDLAESGSVRSDKTSLSSASYNRMIHEHNNNKYLWKNHIKDREEIEIILSAVDLKSYQKLKTFHSNNPGSPIQEFDVFSNSEGESKTEDDADAQPGYSHPTVASILPPYLHGETERVRNTYVASSYNSLKNLPRHLHPGEINLQKKQHVLDNALEKNTFRTSVVPRDKNFSDFAHLGTDYDKNRNLNQYLIEEEKMRIDSYSRRPFVVSSRIRSKFEDIFFDPTFQIPNLGPGGDQRKLESITRADLLNEEKFMYGRFNSYGGKMDLGENSIQEIKKWIHKIHSVIVKDWKDYPFRIKFTKTNELLIQFMKPEDNNGEENQNSLEESMTSIPSSLLKTSTEQCFSSDQRKQQDSQQQDVQKTKKSVPFPPPNDALHKYMNHLASHGVVQDFGLTKRGDRWNTLEREIVEEKSTISTMKEGREEKDTENDDENDSNTVLSSHDDYRDLRGSSSHASNDLLVNEDTESPKRVKRFSLARAVASVRDSYSPSTLGRSESNNNVSGRLDLSFSETEDGHHPGGHLPPHNSVMSTAGGYGNQFDRNFHEPPSQHQITNVLTGLNPNELHSDDDDDDEVNGKNKKGEHQLSDEMISNHVAYFVNRLMGNSKGNSTRSTRLNSSIVSKSSSLKGNRSVSFTNHAGSSAGNAGQHSNSPFQNSHDSTDSQSSPSLKPLQSSGPGMMSLSHSNSGTNLSAHTSSPVPNKGGARDLLRKSLARASYGVNALETMKEENNEDQTESIEGGFRSGGQNTNNNSIPSSTLHTQRTNSSDNSGKTPLSDQNSLMNNLYIPPLEQQLYRKTDPRKQQKESLLKPPKVLYYLTYSFYAPWVSTRQSDVNKKTALQEREKARKYGASVKKKYSVLPALKENRKTRTKEGLMEDIHNMISQHHNAMLAANTNSVGSGSQNLGQTANSGGQQLSHAISSLNFSNKPRFSSNSTDFEMSSLDAMLYGSRQLPGNASFKQHRLTVASTKN
jgi:hypothetical protein